jgi:hypothetical protein
VLGPEKFEIGDLVLAIPIIGDNPPNYIQRYWMTGTNHLYLVIGVDWSLERLSTITHGKPGKNAPMKYFKLLKKGSKLARLVCVK